VVVSAVTLFLAPAYAQDCADDIYGGWTTTLPADTLLRIRLEAKREEGGERIVTSGQDEPAGFVGRAAADGSAIGFVYYAQNAYRTTLRKDGDGWSGRWSPLPIDDAGIPIDLYFDDDGEGGTGGYFYFRDQRLPSLFGAGARCVGEGIEFSERNLGLDFAGTFNEALTELKTEAAGLAGTAQVTWVRMSEERQAQPAGTPDRPPRAEAHATFADHAPEATGDGWLTAKPSGKGLDVEPLRGMVEAVVEGRLPLVHSVLVATAGELVVEEYFYGYDRDTLHDMRSASKSLASTLVGLAIGQNFIDGSDTKALDFFPQYTSYDNWSDAKAGIELRHLMTMSSGLDANDSDRNSTAAENRYQWQQAQPDWIKLALDAPMIAPPGKRVIYGSANPMILGGVLETAAGGPVEWFAEEALFAPLGIDRYRIFLTPTGTAYLGGGMHLRPRDMLKIGQLYLDGGTWQGKRILPAGWVEESFGKYGALEPLDRNGNQYGYLWWHENYEIGGRTIASVEARGNGGQYIFVVPELELTAVITAGNYRGGLEMTRQSQRIFAQYVLPAFVPAR